jgi:hypothetical protein
LNRRESFPWSKLRAFGQFIFEMRSAARVSSKRATVAAALIAWRKKTTIDRRALSLTN